MKLKTAALGYPEGFRVRRKCRFVSGELEKVILAPLVIDVQQIGIGVFGGVAHLEVLPAFWLKSTWGLPSSFGWDIAAVLASAKDLFVGLKRTQRGSRAPVRRHWF